jgi:HD-like signal output (HDOD) protein
MPAMTIKERILNLVRDKRTQIPTLPVVLSNILRITSNENTSVRDVADFISKDQALANKVLRLANSAYYGLARQVDSIQRAIVVIGFNEIVSLAVGIGVFSALSAKSTHGLLDMHSLWLHAIGSTFATREVVSIARPSRASESRFAPSQESQGQHVILSSLLHDMGKVLFAVYFPDEYGVVLNEARNQKVPLYQTEKELLGLDHSAMASLVMERWNFPAKISMPVLYHHNSQACSQPYKNDAIAVELGSFFCSMAEIGYSGNPVASCSAALLDMLGISPVETKNLVTRLIQQRPDIERFLADIS